MKQILIFFVFAFICLNTFGQNTYRGKIVYMSNPCQTEPCLPGIVFGLETISNNYILAINSDWIWSNNSLIVEDIEYFIDDEVEITGIMTAKQDINSNKYLEIEIQAIKKSTSNIGLLSSSSNKVYYDEVNQIIVIDETLQNQSLTFELIDMQGKIALRKIDIANNGSICIANLLRGVYLYCLTRDGLVICTGKILKNN